MCAVLGFLNNLSSVYSISPPPYLSADPLDISFKDDVTVLLLLGVSFMLHML